MMLFVVIQQLIDVAVQGLIAVVLSLRHVAIMSVVVSVNSAVEFIVVRLAEYAVMAIVAQQDIFVLIINVLRLQ